MKFRPLTHEDGRRLGVATDDPAEILVNGPWAIIRPVAESAIRQTELVYSPPNDEPSEFTTIRPR